MDNESPKQQSLFLESYYRSFGLRPELDLRWFDWFFLRNPLGHSDNYVLVDLGSNQWIGGFGFAKKSYSVGGVSVIGGLGVNGFVNPGHEGRGLYSELISTGLEKENYSERAAFSFPYSGNVPSVKGHWKSGWQSAISLCFAERHIDGPGKDDAQVAYTSEPGDLPAIDFGRLAITSGVSFPRTQTEFNWRFVIRPDRKYRYLTLTAGRETGYLVLGRYLTKDGTERCEIADYRFSSSEILSRLIQKAYFVSAREKYQIVDVLINPGSPSFKLFQELGFQRRADGYELLTYCRKPFALPGDIVVCYGDFDVV